MAEAATSDVFASVPTELVSAALRLAAVAAGVAPIAKLPAGVGTALEAVSCTVSLVPSGRLKVKLTASPSAGLVAPRSIEMAGGVPAGPVMVAPVNDDDTDCSFMP